MANCTLREFRRSRLPWAALLCGWCAILLAGCSTDHFSDLDAYVQQVKARPPGHIPPIPEFETYETFAYKDQDLRDPFTPKQEATIARAGKGGGLKPPTNRHKEALEAFPLDGLEFVGLMENKHQTWALIKAPDHIIYRAKVGNHLGQNYGEITSVSESRVDLVEIVPNGLGGWMKRDAAIALKE